MRRGAAEALWRAEDFASLYLNARRNAKHPTPNFLYWAIGDERCKFLQWADGGPISASLCSDARRRNACSQMLSDLGVSLPSEPQ